MGIEGYRKLRMVLGHSRLDRHVHQTRHTAIGEYSRLAQGKLSTGSADKAISETYS